MSVNNFKELREHVGHDIVCVGYGLKDRTGKIVTEFQNVSIECETCNEVLLDFDRFYKKEGS